MKLNIPDHVLTLLEPYGRKVMECPSRYYENVSGMEPVNQLDGDPFNDPTLPGVHPDFPKHHDLKERLFVPKNETGIYTLDKNIMQNIKRLLYPPFDIQAAIIEWLEDEAFPEWKYHSTSGRFFYPGDGGFMGWHTNADAPGMRIYLAYSEDEKGSMFRYFDNEKNETVDDYDDKGWTARAFFISDNPSHHYWHCVNADKPRMSIGFRMVRK